MPIHSIHVPENPDQMIPSIRPDHDAPIHRTPLGPEMTFMCMLPEHLPKGTMLVQAVTADAEATGAQQQQQLQFLRLALD